MQLGLSLEPAYRQLLANIGAQTGELDQLWQQQQAKLGRAACTLTRKTKKEPIAK